MRQERQVHLVNITEIHHNFCLTYLHFHFAKNVSTGYQSCFRHLLQFQCSDHRRVHIVEEVKSSLE